MVSTIKTSKDTIPESGLFIDEISNELYVEYYVFQYLRTIPVEVTLTFTHYLHNATIQ